MLAITGRTIGGKLIALATAGLIGAGALGGVAAAATARTDDQVIAAVPTAPGVAVAPYRDRGDAMKKILDALVATGTITPAQKDAIVKELGEVANATTGKSRDGLVAALTAEASKRIAAAVTAGKLTVEQAAAAQVKAAIKIGKFVDHKNRPKPAKPANPAKPVTD